QATRAADGPPPAPTPAVAPPVGSASPPEPNRELAPERLRPETAPPPTPNVAPPADRRGILVPAELINGSESPRPVPYGSSLFTGTHPCKVDDNNRVVLPDEVDRELGSPAFVYFAPGVGGSLWLLTAEVLERTGCDAAGMGQSTSA